VRVHPTINTEGTQGVVIMETKVPRRVAATDEAHLEAICDIGMLEWHAKQFETEQPHSAVKGHAHLHEARFPPISEDPSTWKKKGEMCMQEKVLQQSEAGLDSPKTKRQPSKPTRGPALGEDNSGVGDTLEDFDVLSESVSPASSPASSRAGSKMSSFISRGGSPRGSPRTASKRSLNTGLLTGDMDNGPQQDRARRMGMDLTAAVGDDDDLPWDARPPPTGPEAKSFFERIAFATSVKAVQRREAAAEPQPGTRSSKPEGSAWTLEAVGSLNFTLTFTAAVGVDDTLVSIEDHDKAQDEAFWEDFFQPVSGTGRELKCFGACTC